MSKEKKSLLMRLKVGPVSYSVHAAKHLRNENEELLSGQCNSIIGRIYVDPGFFPSSQRSTLFHEAIHAVDHVYGVGLTEEQVRLLEVGILSLIDDNPQLLDFNRTSHQ